MLSGFHQRVQLQISTLPSSEMMSTGTHWVHWHLPTLPLQYDEQYTLPGPLPSLQEAGKSPTCNAIVARRIATLSRASLAAPKRKIPSSRERAKCRSQATRAISKQCHKQLTTKIARGGSSRKRSRQSFENAKSISMCVHENRTKYGITMAQPASTFSKKDATSEHSYTTRNDVPRSLHLEVYRNKDEARQISSNKIRSHIQLPVKSTAFRRRRL